MLLFDSKCYTAGSVLLRNLHSIVIVVRQPLLIIRERGETLLQFLKFATFFRAGRTLNHFAVLSRFCSILLRFKHTGLLSSEVSAHSGQPRWLTRIATDMGSKVSNNEPHGTNKKREESAA